MSFGAPYIPQISSANQESLMLPCWRALAPQVLSLASPVLESEFTMGNFTQPSSEPCSSFPSLVLALLSPLPRPKKQQTIKYNNSGPSYTHCSVLAAKSPVQGLVILRLCCITPYALQEGELRITPCRISLGCCDSSPQVLSYGNVFSLNFHLSYVPWFKQAISINLFMQL